jgi:hypothetical protein
MRSRLSKCVILAGILVACGGPRSETGFSSGMPTSAVSTAADSESSTGSSSSTSLSRQLVVDVHGLVQQQRSSRGHHLGHGHP